MQALGIINILELWIFCSCKLVCLKYDPSQSWRNNLTKHFTEKRVKCGPDVRALQVHHERMRPMFFIIRNNDLYVNAVQVKTWIQVVSPYPYVISSM